MKKIKLIGIGNQDKYNFIIVEKSPDFFNWIGNLLYPTFGKGLPDFTYLERVDNEGEVIRENKNINDYTDYHENLFSNKDRVDVFYGKSKIFITIYTDLSKREKLMKTLGEITTFSKNKK